MVPLFLAMSTSAQLAMPHGEDLAYWTIVRKMALAATIAAAKADVRLLQAGRVAEFKALYQVGHRPAFAVVRRLEPIVTQGVPSSEAFDAIELLSERVVGTWLISDIENRFVGYAGSLNDLTFRPRDQWPWSTRLLDVVVRVKAAQYRDARAN